MSKIEELLGEYITGWMGYGVDTPTSDVVKAMKEFGRICFNAGNQVTISPEENDKIYLVYHNYEGF